MIPLIFFVFGEFSSPAVFSEKGPAQHFARVPAVEVCEADLRFWKAKLGTLNHSNAARF